MLPAAVNQINFNNCAKYVLSFQLQRIGPVSGSVAIQQILMGLVLFSGRYYIVVLKNPSDTSLISFIDK